MKKAKVKAVCDTVSFLLGFFGLILCACEPATVEQQMTNGLIGLGMLAVAVFISWVVRRGEENELYP